MTPEQFAETAAAIETEIGKVIVGQAAWSHDVLAACWPGATPCSKACPGLGKTHAGQDAGRGARPAVQRASSSRPT